MVPNDGAIGLGTLRLDGFMSVDAGNRGGVLTTKPLAIEGKRLYVNANAAEGELRVEIVDDILQAHVVVDELPLAPG